MTHAQHHITPSCLLRRIAASLLRAKLRCPIKYLNTPYTPKKVVAGHLITPGQHVICIYLCLIPFVVLSWRFHRVMVSKMCSMKNDQILGHKAHEQQYVEHIRVVPLRAVRYESVPPNFPVCSHNAKPSRII